MSRGKSASCQEFFPVESQILGREIIGHCVDELTFIYVSAFIDSAALHYISYFLKIFSGHGFTPKIVDQIEIYSLDNIRLYLIILDYLQNYLSHYYIYNTTSLLLALCYGRDQC